MYNQYNTELKIVSGEIKPDFNKVEYKYLKKLNKEIKVEKSYYLLKRYFDVCVGLIALYLTFPIIIIFSILIFLETFSNPIYSQIRVGLMGKPIKIYKIRSMYKDAEKNGIKWADANDPRITKIGKLIRKTRIDELPQLINVIKGDMSFIGPRPERPEFVELFSESINGFEKRCLVKPGLSGLAQIQGGYELSPSKKLQYDLKYIEKGSLLMEVFIILKTFVVIVTGSGAR
ncbi:sugar transferase [Mammaliicoccus sciuri]|uniref:sugar transferase n=1 Tax=Mammaliicoccus sciuri TaxID=1296 RepID=UPI0019502865|nr:sugar transferase [Mammaliicoccus sciuri]